MTIPESSVALFAVVLGLAAISGFRGAVGTFGRRMAPYCLTASVCMFIALLVGWMVVMIFDTSALG